MVYENHSGLFSSVDDDEDLSELTTEEIKAIEAAEERMRQTMWVDFAWALSSSDPVKMPEIWQLGIGEALTYRALQIKESRKQIK